MVTMRTRLAAWVCLLGLGCGSAWAQQPPTPATPPAPFSSAGGPPSNLTAIVVDVQALLQNSKAAKMVRQQIEGKRQEYAKDIQHKDQSLRQEEEALEKQKATLSGEQLTAKGRELQGKFDELRRDVQAKTQALERSNADSLKKIQEVMVKIITDIAKDRKANMVFQRTDLVLFDPGFDVTDDVLQKLDEQMPTLTVDFVAPVAANSPDAGQTPSTAQPAATAAKPKKK
jgi:Skp family chaperone for outer membrane proteins